MKGIHPSPRDLAELRENLRVLTETVESLYFRPSFVAGNGALGAGALFVNVVGAAVQPSVEFPNAGSPEWRIERPRLPRWRAAYVRVTIAYTATAGSTNAFVLGLRLREHGAGDVHPVALLVNQNLTLPGPAVANTEMRFVWVSSAIAVNGAKSGLAFSHIRLTGDAADVNAASLHVLSVTWEILPG